MILPDANNGKQIHLNDDTNTPVLESEVSGYINEFFTSIGPRLVLKDTSNYQYHGQRYPSNFNFEEITVD